MNHTLIIKNAMLFSFGLVAVGAWHVALGAESNDVQASLAQIHALQTPERNTTSSSNNNENSNTNNNKRNENAATAFNPGAVPSSPSPQENPFGIQPQASAPVPRQQLQQGSQNTTAADVGESAFAAMANNMLPLTGDQIHRLKQMFNATQAATAASAGTPPRPKATSQFVSLAPGATPPVIRLAQGFVTSVVFLDSTGSPWPIESYDIGDPNSFNIVWNKKDNNLMVQSMSLYNYGNLAVRLRDLNTPVMITLIPGQSAVDYRVDMRIQGLGPNAKATVGDTLPSTENNELLTVLDGVPPAGARLIQVSGGDAQVWVVGEKMYVRTSDTVLSPGWLSTLSSADGTHVYLMQKAPLLLVSAHGKVMQLKLQGF